MEKEEAGPGLFFISKIDATCVSDVYGDSDAVGSD